MAKPATPTPEIAERVWNHYRCEQCDQLTIAKDETAGVTPFMVRCHATRGCQGAAFSTVYRGSQDPAQEPHIIFFRPSSAQVDGVIEQLTKNRMHRRLMREHYDKGGALMRVARH